MFFVDTAPWGVIKFWRLHSLASFEKKILSRIYSCIRRTKIYLKNQKLKIFEKVKHV